MSYNCKHFTKAWSNSFGPDGKNVKGEAGERMTYEVLREIARDNHLTQLELLGESDPVDTAILARKSKFPDCWIRIDDLDWLFEVRNVCYYHADWSGKLGWNHTFYLQDSAWVAGVTKGKDWWEERYPIRNTRRMRWNTVTKQREAVWDWTPMLSMNTNKRKKTYVSTVASFNDKARTKLDDFYGKREIFTEHPIMTPELAETDEDKLCFAETHYRLRTELEKVLGLK
jgi:hypothetical protein